MSDIEAYFKESGKDETSWFSFQDFVSVLKHLRWEDHKPVDIAAADVRAIAEDAVATGMLDQVLLLRYWF